MYMWDRCAMFFLLQNFQSLKLPLGYCCSRFRNLSIFKHIFILVKKSEGCVWLFLESPSQSYGASPAICAATRQVNMSHFNSSQARQYSVVLFLWTSFLDSFPVSAESNFCYTCNVVRFYISCKHSTFAT